jgi:hypothetical protein
MPFFFYLVMLVLVSVSIAAGIFFILYKRNHHPKLYREGLRRENEGQYSLALDSYERALNEINRRNVSHRFRDRIAQKIKILRTTVNYENNFRNMATPDHD